MAVRRLGTYEVGSSSNNPRTSAYNILPLNADAEICKLPEVKAARNELTRFPVKEGDDVFDLLKEKFLFQEDNIKNQREHLILLLSNARSADYDKDPASVKGKDQDLPVATVRSLFEKIMDNYWKWCSHVRIRSPDCRREEEDKQCMLKHVALYLCIWGEAANVRFLPECICFLFHNLAKLLEHQGPLYPEGQTFLTAIITPIYEKIKEEADKGKKANQKHSKWKNYDDFNELFWSNLLFKLPQDNPIQPSNQLHLPEDDPIQHFQHNPGQPSKIKYFKDHFEDAYKNTESKKISYVERRTFFHLYHSFVRVWILLIVLLEILVACAFSGNSLVLLLKLLICIGPTYFVMKFLKSVLDVVMMIGISVQVLSRCHVKASIIFQLLFYGACSFGTIFLYRKMILEMPPNEILLWMLVPLGAYVVIFILRHAVRRQVERMERYKFLACLNWLYRDYFYVGGRLSEKGFYYWRYALFWLLLLGCKASFSYFFQIKPLAEASKSIYPHNEIVIYQWHDLISKRNHNALALMSLWAPVILIYLLDIQIWFTVFSAVVGGILGSKDRLAEIHSLDMLRARFDTFPAELAVRLLASKKQTSAPKGIIISQAKTFSKFWNQIIKCLRNEDYIKDYEEELLIMPEGFNNYITWPLFLLAGKVSLAIKLATENPEELFERLKNDKFMSLAIREAYASASYYYDTLIDGHKDYEIKKLGIERKLSEIDKSSPDKEYKHIARIYRKVKKLVWLTDMDNQKKVNIRAVADALQSIYVDVSKFVKNEKYVQRADVRSTTMPNEIQVEDINLPANENKRTRRQKPLEPKFIRRLHWLLASTEAHSSVPKNEEAQRRLQFFTNSLFMRMPQAPSIRAMKAFSVLTPYYREPVIYSVKDLYLDNEDGISILFYLQKVFPDEWENLLERLKITEKMLTDILIKASNISTGKDAFSKSDAEKVRETRLWASYRGQTLARTVRGMMYYREALRFQACMEEREIEKNEINPEARAEALTDLKFSYVVSCQRYGEQKKHTEREEREKAEDIQELMRTHDGLRIAFVHSEGKCYYSKLIKMSDTGEQEIYKIQLPGNPILGEGKPENQNHSIIFTRGEALQAIDMNQDNYFEEALKMRNLLEQFKPPDKGPQATILGVREHIFTGSVSSLAWFMSKQEASFVTLGQRVLARPLRVRMHYGHPDVFDRLFHLTRGGMSKASKAINVSEDVFAGFNSTMRNGNITHHEYIQVGKGRDVGLNQISMFEAKVSSGNAEQLLSRDVFRLGNSFDLFRLLSFYVTSVGYYACTMMTSLTIYVFLYGKAYLALSGLWRIFDDLALRNHDKPLQTALGTQFLFQIGFFTAIPMLVMFMIEEGFIKAVVNIVVMQLQLSSVFFTFSLGTRSHYFSRTVLQGGAKYQDTGRNFVVQHIKFAQNYRLYSRSHFVNAFEIMMLLIVIRVYGPQKSPQSYILFSFFCWFLAISWLFAPFIFNPSGFEWQKTVEDYNNWVKWLLGRDNFDPNAKDCWENWWMEQQASNASIMSILLRTALSLRFLFPQFGIIYHLEKVKNDTSILIYGISWLIFIGIIMLFLTFSYRSNYPGSMRPIRGVLYMILFISFVMVEVLGIISINDIFATIFALIPTGWGLLCIAMIWSEYIQQSPIKPIWSIVKATAWYYDAAMGMLIFIPIAVLSWFQFVSIFQTRLLFNQAFSRGLEISRILSARKQQDDEGSTAKIK